MGGTVSLLILVSGSVAGVTTEAWTTYSGAWFDISHPKSYRVFPRQKSQTSREGFDSASFVSAGGEVEFNVYSPQWSGKAATMDIDLSSEHLSAKKVSAAESQTGAEITETWLCLSALNGSYVRFVHEHRDSVQGTWAFAIKCKDMNAYRQHQNEYKRFRESLIQYAD
jgi:hypothetical protein